MNYYYKYKIEYFFYDTLKTDMIDKKDLSNDEYISKIINSKNKLAIKVVMSATDDINTYNKLKEAKLTNTNDILKMSLEDAGKIIQDPILQNIILLREFIKEKKALHYFIYDKTTAKYRTITFRKLVEINKINENEITKLTLEELEPIIKNDDFYNILLLRKLLKSGNSFDFFDENIKLEREELKNEQ